MPSRRLALTLVCIPLTASALTNGVPVGAGEALAVVSLEASSASTYGWCSGFFVGPDVVLTAQHCIVTDKTGLLVDGEWTVADVKSRRPVTGERHALDLALLRVNYSNRDYYSIATSIAPDAGEIVELYGFGPALNAAGQMDGSTLKRKGFAPISRVNDVFILTKTEILPYDASAASGALKGDSGGPMLLDGVAIGVAAKGGLLGPSAYTHLLSDRAQEFLKAAAQSGWNISFAK